MASRFYVTHYGRRMMTLPDTPEGRERTRTEVHALRAFNVAVEAMNDAVAGRQRIEARNTDLYAKVADPVVREQLVREATAAEVAELREPAAGTLAMAVAEHRKAERALAELPALVAFELPKDVAAGMLDAEMRAFLRGNADRIAFVHAAARNGDDRVLRAILTAHHALSGTDAETWQALHDRVVAERHVDELADRARSAEALQASGRAIENAAFVIAEATGAGVHDLERQALAVQASE